MDIRVRRGEKVESLGRPISLYREEKKDTFQQQNIYQFMIDLDFCLMNSETSKLKQEIQKQEQISVDPGNFLTYEDNFLC